MPNSILRGVLVWLVMRPNVEGVIEAVGWNRLPGLTRGARQGAPETEDFA